MTTFELTLYKNGATYQSASNDRRYMNFRGDLTGLLVELRKLAGRFCNYDHVPSAKEKSQLPALGQGLMGKDGTGRRARDNAISAQVLGLDFDNKGQGGGKVATREDILGMLDKAGLEFLFYESPSSMAEHFKCRVLLVLDEVVSDSGRYEDIYRAVVHSHFGDLPGLDMSCADISRLFYISPYPKMERAIVGAGRPLCVGALDLKQLAAPEKAIPLTRIRSKGQVNQDEWLAQVLGRLTAGSLFNHPAHQWKQNRGQRWLGACPRHVSASGRSFHVDAETLEWYCFGCKVGGGPLQYLGFCEGLGTMLRGADFITCARRLFDMAGVAFSLDNWAQGRVEEGGFSAAQVADLAQRRFSYRLNDKFVEPPTCDTEALRRASWSVNESRAFENFLAGEQLANLSMTGDGKTYSIALAAAKYFNFVADGSQES